MALSAGDILAFTGSCPTETIHVAAFKRPDGDDSVIVRGMTSDELEMHQSRTARLVGRDGKGKAHASAHLLYLCVVDETNGRVFTKDQIDQLAQLPSLYVEQITDAIGRLSVFDKDAEDEARGESETAQTSDSDSE